MVLRPISQVGEVLAKTLRKIQDFASLLVILTILYAH
jgi:hypothetical protein